MVANGEEKLQKLQADEFHLRPLYTIDEHTQHLEICITGGSVRVTNISKLIEHLAGGRWLRYRPAQYHAWSSEVLCGYPCQVSKSSLPIFSQKNHESTRLYVQPFLPSH